MEYKTALEKKIEGDWVSVAKICGISRPNASVISRRPKSKKYRMVMDALVAVVEAREKAIEQEQLKHLK